MYGKVFNQYTYDHQEMHSLYIVTPQVSHLGKSDIYMYGQRMEFVSHLPVHVVFALSFNPTISNSSPTLKIPVSILPVATVPRPEIEKVSSTGIKNGLSVSRVGVGIALSTASISFKMAFFPISASPPVVAANADPCTISISSPGNS